jgi:hypothetical protein
MGGDLTDEATGMNPVEVKMPTRCDLIDELSDDLFDELSDDLFDELGDDLFDELSDDLFDALR